MYRLLTGLGVLLVFGSTVGCCTIHRQAPGCVGGACGVADGGCCCGGSYHQGPFSPLDALLGCSSGCGEVYWDEWASDPPDCCDPCDQCGNWIGPQGVCGSCAQPLNHGNLWGQRYAGACGPMCDHCAGGETFYDGGIDQTWTESIEGRALPRPAPRVHTAAASRPRNVFQQLLGPDQPRARTVRYSRPR